MQAPEMGRDEPDNVGPGGEPVVEGCESVSHLGSTPPSSGQINRPGLGSGGKVVQLRPASVRRSRKPILADVCG